MEFAHDDHEHEVSLMDDGTMDTVLDIDGIEFRYSEADRHEDGTVKATWMYDMAIEACDDGSLESDDPTEPHSFKPDELFPGICGVCGIVRAKHA